MNRVLILGAGFGGLAAAHMLRERLAADDEIVLVDRGDRFMMGFRKTWSIVGEDIGETFRRRLRDVERHGIRFVQGEITAIDPEAKSAIVGGQTLQADALIVALGAELAPEAVPGFSEHGLNFYSPNEIGRSRDALRAFQGGRVVVGILGEPYKCPPAPFEFAFLLNDYFTQREIKVDLEVSTPKPMSLPVLGAGGCEALEGRLAEAGIRFLPSHISVRIEAGRVIYKTATRPFDLLFGVPPHRAPQVVIDSGLATAGGWIQADARTLETRFPGVYAAGDIIALSLADGKPHPKAGVFAEAHGRVAAERVAARFAGKEPNTTNSGEGYCFLEVGRGEAMLVRGKFLAEPAPEVELTQPSPEHVAAKERFEQERLDRWFG